MGKLLKKPDIVLILVLLFIGCLFVGYNLWNGQQGSYVEVQVSGKVVQTFSLDENREYDIKSDNGTNTLVIENGNAYVKDASCPDGLCEKMGKISKDGQSIICLPNEVVIEVIGSKSDDIDVVVGG